MKIGVVGVGAVGETCAHGLVASNVATELVLLNRTIKTAVAIELDLRQARAWRGNLLTESGPLIPLDPVVGCDLLVLAVGPRLWGEQARADIALESAKILKDSDLVGELARLRDALPPVLVVTNPVEPMVTWLWERTGISPSRLFGLGTTVDSARFSMHVANRFDVDARSAWTTLVGEHGPGVLIAGSGQLAGVVERAELTRHEATAELLTKKDAKRVRNLTEEVAVDSATKLLKMVETSLEATMADTTQRKALIEEIARWIAPPATRFAIAAAVTEVAKAIHTDERRVLTVSSAAPSEWGLPPVALALPFRVGRGDVNRCLLETPPDGLTSIASDIETIARSLPCP